MMQGLTRLRGSGTVTAINAAMRKPGFIILLALWAALGGVFALDLPVYAVLVLAAVYVCLLGEDLLPVLPMAILCYVIPSRDNNPGRNPDSIFYPENGGYILFALGALFAVCLVFRLVTDREMGFFRVKRKLLWGMVALGGAYLISGIGLDNYGDIAGRNLLFALIQFAAVFVMYYLFTGAVKWEKAPRNYLAWTGMCVGLVVLAELVENYASGRLFVVQDGVTAINRYNMATGWGMHNNIGGMLAMSIPFCFYLACKEKHGWIYNLLAIALMLGVVMSFSRSSMLLGGLAFVIGAAILLLRYDKGRKNLLIYGIAAAALVALAVIFREKIGELISKFLSDDLGNVSSRDKLIVNGFKQYLSEPIFGGSFYPQGEYVPWDYSDQAAFSAFFPPRWHNTLIQMLASCGTVGIVAYGFHRFQTVKLLLTRRSTEKTFIALYLLVLVGTCLLDCHFFNVGPTLFYSMAMAFAEKIELSKV